MKIMLKTIIITLIYILTINTSFAQSKVVAKFDGGQITLEELERVESALTKNGANKEFLRKSYNNILNEIGRNKIFINEAIKLKIDQDKFFQAQVDEYKKNLLARAFLDSKISGQITEESIRKDYDKLVSDPKNREEIQVAHILVDSEKEASDIIKKLNSGGNFAEIARSQSKDTGSAKKGGDLGYITRGMMVPEFEKAAFLLGNKEITKSPVKSSFGFHVIKKLDVRIRPIPKYEEVRENIAKNLVAKLSQQLFEEYSKKLSFQVLPDPRIEN